MADEYIKRTLAKAEFTGNFRDEYPTALIHALIDSIPAADVQPVRHGRWVEVEVDKDDDGIPTLIMAGCDQCHFVSWTATPFCGYCGAKMDGWET